MEDWKGPHGTREPQGHVEEPGRWGRGEVNAPDDAVQAADLLVGTGGRVPAAQLLGRAAHGQASARAVLFHGDSFHLSRGTTWSL